MSNFEQFQEDEMFGYIHPNAPWYRVFVAAVASNSDHDGPIYFDVTARAFSGPPSEARAHAHAILAACDYAESL